MGSTGARGQHGGDGRRIAAQLGMEPRQVLDLSASLNPFAPPVTELLVEQAKLIAEYPDAEHSTGLVAAAVGVDPQRLVLTNGGSEAIALVAQRVGSGSLAEPEFSLYRRHLQTVEAISADAIVKDRWRSNPNNPLGKLANPGDTALVWDEAFYPLATGQWTRADETSWRLGSLTKLWSCPGLRLGYVIAPSVSEADDIRHLQPRWSVNALALGLIPELLLRTDLPGWATDISGLRNRFVDELELLGFEVTASSANWVLVHQSPELKQRLAALGVIVRDCASFGLGNTHRIALPTPATFDRVMTSISQCRNR